MNNRWSILILLLTALNLCAESESEDQDVSSLNEIVVTESPTNRRIKDTPVSVTVISREDIENSPAKNIDDLLEKQVGIQVKRSVGMGEGVPSDLMIRGIPGSLVGSRVLILVDGVPTNASGTPFLVLSELPLESIRNVEIVRGAYSSLYGANAFAGVINSNTLYGYGKLTLRGSLESSFPFTLAYNSVNGQNDDMNSLEESFTSINIAADGGNDKSHYLFNGAYRSIGNYLMSDDAIVRSQGEVRSKSSDNHDYEDIRLFGKGGTFLSDNFEIEMSGRFFSSELGFGRTKQLEDTADVSTAGLKWVVNPSFKYYARDNLTIKGGAYYRGMIGEFWNEEALPTGEYVPSYWKSVMNDWQIDAQAVWGFHRNHLLVGGVDFLNNGINFQAKEIPESGEVIDGSMGSEAGIQNVGVYAQDEIKFFEKLSAIPGVRFDYHSDFKVVISPKMGLFYRLNDAIRFRSSAGRAFRAPTLTELFMPETRINSSLVISANPDLQPEYLWAYDFSVEYFPSENSKLLLGAYYNNMNGLIGQKVDLTDTDDPKVTHSNISEAWSRGIEFDSRFQISNSWNLSGSFVWQQSRDEYASQIAIDFQESDTDIPLDYIPQFQADAGIRYTIELGENRLSLDLSESFTGKRSYLDWASVDITNPDQVKIILGSESIDVVINPPRVFLDSYFRTDGAIRFEFENSVWLALNVQNIFNVEFEEQGGTRAPGRFASMKVGGEFSFE